METVANKSGRSFPTMGYCIKCTQLLRFGRILQGTNGKVILGEFILGTNDLSETNYMFERDHSST